MENKRDYIPLFTNETNKVENLFSINESESSSDDDNQTHLENLTRKSTITLNRTKITQNKNKSQNQKYHDDIVHILKYAEENNPHSLIIELCQNLKWAFPNVQSYQIVENNVNVYKTQIKLKTFTGEAIGITKKISKSKLHIYHSLYYINLLFLEKACTELLVKMIEDKTVRDSLRMYIDTKTITRDCQLKEEENEDGIKLEEEEFEKPVYKDSDLDLARVKQIITDYNKDNFTNPLTILDGFKNRYLIPVSFTYTIKEKMHKAVTYVGGKICNYKLKTLNIINSWNWSRCKYSCSQVPSSRGSS